MEQQATGKMKVFAPTPSGSRVDKLHGVRTEGTDAHGPFVASDSQNRTEVIDIGGEKGGQEASGGLLTTGNGKRCKPDCDTDGKPAKKAKRGVSGGGSTTAMKIMLVRLGEVLHTRVCRYRAYRSPFWQGRSRAGVSWPRPERNRQRREPCCT